MDISKINKEYPIKLNKIEHIINKIQQQYPALDKINIIIIINKAFEIIRRELITGKTIQINNIMFGMKIKKYQRVINQKKIEHIKVKISTPRKFKK